MLDAALNGPGVNWSLRRTYHAALGGLTLVGNHWFAESTDPVLTQSGSDVVMASDAWTTVTFTAVTGGFKSPADSPWILVHDSTNHRYVVTNTTSDDVVVFYDFSATGFSLSLRGHLAEVTTVSRRAAGLAGLVYTTYNSVGRPTQITTAAGQSASVTLTYANDRLDTVTITDASSTQVQKVAYTYYISGTHSSNVGTAGDLVLVKRSAKDSLGNWIDDYTHYRYASSGKLVGVFNNDAMQSILTSGNSSLDTVAEILAAGNSTTVAGSRTLDQYANKWFTYYTSNESTSSIVTPWSTSAVNLESDYAPSGNRNETGFVKSERIGAGGCSSCGSGGAVTKHYFYLTVNASATDDNQVKNVVLEDTVDAAGVAQYRTVWGTNPADRLLRKAIIDNPYSSPKFWCSSWKLTKTADYQTTGKDRTRNRIIEYRGPSAYKVASHAHLVEFLSPYDAGTASWTNETNWVRDNADALAGPTEVYVYNDDGQMTDRKVKRGYDGTAYYLWAGNYGNGSSVPTNRMTAYYYYPTKTATRASGIDVQLTYAFWDPTTKKQLQKVTTTNPAVPTTENGSGIATVTEDYFDQAGRQRWHKDAEGYVTYYSYDVISGQVAYVAVDVDPSSLPGSSTGDSRIVDRTADGALSSGGFPTRSVASPYTAPTALALVTQYMYDAAGRLSETIAADGSRSSTLYEQLSSGGWRVTQFEQLDSSGNPKLPSSVTLYNKLGQVIEQCSLAATFTGLTTAGGVPTGYSTAPTQADYVGWTRYFYDDLGRLAKSLSYHDIPSPGDGAAVDNFYVTASHYDDLGRVDKTYQLVDKEGSGYQEQITAYMFDRLNRTTAVQRVVSGTGHSLGLDLTASATLGTITLPTSPALTTVSTTTYDGGGVGDGRVTSSRRYHTSSTYTDVTNYYTYRGFLRGSKRTYGSGATAVGPYSIRDVDWLGRADDSAVYTTVSSGDWTGLTAGDGDDDYVASNSTYRHSRVTVAYDKIGRPYQTDRYLGQKDWKERTFTYYDRLGRVVGAGSPYGVAQETAYDGAGRAYQTRTVTTLVADAGTTGKYDSSGAFKYRGPAPHPSLTTMAGGTQDDGVVEMAHTLFDAATHDAIGQHQFEMVHTESGSTLGIDLSANDDYVRRTVYSWYDANTNQLTAMADYGAGGTGGTGTWKYNAIPTRPSSAPATSGDHLVVTYGYDAATGRQLTVTAPGPGSTTVTTKTWYDKLGRVVHVSENQQSSGGFDGTTGQGGGTNNDQDRVVSRTYNALGQTKTLTAYNPSGSATNPETTKYFYFDDLDTALLTDTVYPDSSDTATILSGRDAVSGSDHVHVAYNIDGSRSQMTDQRGVVHAYEYDSARRLSFDKATTIPTPVYGSGTDTDAVRAIGYTYNDLGQPQAITSYNNTSATTVLNSVYYYYSTGGGYETDTLQQIFQHHDNTTGVSGPRIYFDRDWAVESGTNVLRNAARVVFIQYPNGQTVNLNYNGHYTSTSGWSTDGNDDGLNDRLSRLGGITFTTSTTPFSGDFRVATYAYNGTSRLVATDYVDSPGSHNGPKIRRDMYNSSSGNDYDAWDRFGRTLRSQWDNYSSGTTTIDKVEYAYDNAGNRLSRNVAAGANDVYDYVYSYDALGRLIDAKAGTYSSGTIASPALQQTWGLDQLGNWGTFSESASGSLVVGQSRTHNAVNEITALSKTAGTAAAWASPPTYDGAGNMTDMPTPADPTVNYALKYDAWNRLVQVLDAAGTTTIQQNHYDGRNYRIVRESYASGSLTETRHYYYNDEWQVVEERVGATASSARVDAQWVYHPQYVDAPALRYWDSDASGGPDNLHYYLQDANYNVTALVDGVPSSANLGKVVERYAYTPYGVSTVLHGTADGDGGSDWQVDSTGTDVANVVRYTGRELDAATGLQLNRWRFYASHLGRWLGRDPLQYGGGSLNLFGYVYGVPTQGVDPLGQVPVTCHCCRPGWVFGPGLGIAVPTCEGDVEVAADTAGTDSKCDTICNKACKAAGLGYNGGAKGCDPPSGPYDYCTGESLCSRSKIEASCSDAWGWSCVAACSGGTAGGGVIPCYFLCWLGYKSCMDRAAECPNP